jgi:hypothetical protein
MKVVCFFFVPGHAGAMGNERAVRLADLAVLQGGIAIDRSDIRNVPRDNWRVSHAENDSESTTIIRLHVLHVKAGSVRQQQLSAG